MVPRERSINSVKTTPGRRRPVSRRHTDTLPREYMAALVFLKLQDTLLFLLLMKLIGWERKYSDLPLHRKSETWKKCLKSQETRG